MVKTYQIYELDFQNSPLHLSRGKSNTYTDSDNWLHSDSIKSAIFSAAIELLGESRAEREFFDCFQVSSAFPMFKNTHFLPKPHFFGLGIADAKQRKPLRQTQFLSLKYWEKYANGTSTEDHLRADDKLESPFVSATTQRVWIKYAFEDDPNVDLNGLTDEDLNLSSTPFYIDKLFLKKDHKLYFFVAPTEGVSDTLFFKDLDAIMRLLGDNGIGLQRGVGNGHFTAQRRSLSLNLPDTADAQMSLSLFCPADADSLAQLNLSSSYYQLIKRGGWIATPVTTFRKRSIFMFTEGSVFKTPRTPQGKSEDLTPDIYKAHPIWRDGNALFLPIVSRD